MTKNEELKSTQLFDNQIMRIEQVAQMLQASKWHVYRLVSADKIPFHRKGRTLYFIRSEILEWIMEDDY